MARTRIVSITRNGQRNTRIEYRGGGTKKELEIPGGMQEFRDWIRSTIRDDQETLIAIVLATWLAKNPASTDFSSIIGKTVTLDLEAQTLTGIITII